MSIIFVYVTVADADEAQEISGALLEKKLIACANIPAPHTAMYRWEGKNVAESEQAMYLKTRADLFDRVQEEICAMHSYDTPCILAWPADKGYGPFLEWVGNETGSFASKDNTG